MAGGIGSRFWPLSTKKTPKQFLDILGVGRTLLQQTVDRFSQLCPVENIYIVSSVNYKDIIQEQVPEVLEQHILLEPFMRNTAPCIAYANHKILKANPDATVIVAPSDHLITDTVTFNNIVNNCVEFASSNDMLLTLGIKPHRIETGYGYIQFQDKSVDPKLPDLKPVKIFTEKPSYNTAKVFIDSGEFYWNSGIFIWSLKSIMKSFDDFLPDMNSLFSQYTEKFDTSDEVNAINDIYNKCEKISIDYGIMEKAKNVCMYCSDFGWSDLGTWGSLYEHVATDEDGNYKSNPKVVTKDVKNTIVASDREDRIMVVKGLEDYIVVDSDRALLVWPKSDEQDIKEVVNSINASEM